ncbi:MAG: BASS family bile acid:Na+ symporter [Cyclobacteriaceae bacterium]|jgi:BASS family bile acid:Na+ symporter
MFETLQEIDNVRLNFNAEGKQLLNLTIAFIMFGVALELRLDDFSKLWKNPKPALVGIISQFLFMPAMTFGLTFLLRDYITPTVGLGMVLVAACPGGNVSNFISSLAKGNVALSVSLTAFSSIASLLLTPFNFAFWGNLFLKFSQSSNSISALPTLNIEIWSVMETIIMIIGIPLIAGTLFSKYLPKLTQKILLTIKRLSVVTFLAIVVMIFASNYEHFVRYIQYIFLIVLVHNALSFAMGYYFGKAAGLNLQDRKTISVETGIQNSGLALALLFNPSIFPESLNVGGMAFIAAWWGIWHIIAGMSIAGLWTGFRLKTVKIID